MEQGLTVWDLVQFNDNGVDFSAGHTYFKAYDQYYTNVVPFALSNFINMVTNKAGLFIGVNIWEAGDGKYCKYKEYFDHLISMSMIHRCELLHFKNDRCSNKELREFLDNKKKAQRKFEEYCLSKIFKSCKIYRPFTNFFYFIYVL